jgi:hypothetical protein
MLTPFCVMEGSTGLLEALEGKNKGPCRMIKGVAPLSMVSVSNAHLINGGGGRVNQLLQSVRYIQVILSTVK